MIKDKIIESLNFRHACKEFNPTKKIKDEDFDLILESMRLSPSSMGLEPWKFLLVQNKELRDRLKDIVWGGQKQIPTASHLIIALTKKSYFMRYDSEYISNFMTSVQHHPKDIKEFRLNFFKKFQEEDHKLLESERAIFDWASKQSYIPIANMMNTAAMLKIDTCAIEGFNKEKVDNILKKYFNVDITKYSISYMLTFGYRVNPPKEKTRQNLEDILEFF
jgi:nitroreductase